MANYTFLDAYSSVKTAASSTIGGIEYPIVKMPDAVTVNPTSVSGTVGASIIGSVPVTLSGTPSISGTVNIGNAPSVYGNISGSVAAFMGGSWAVSVVGGPLNINSILGTYLEDSAHAAATPGLLTFGVRNDAVASFVGANQDYAPIGLDPAGRVLFKPFASEEARVEGYNSVVSGSVTTLVAAAGAGLRNYVTDVMIANTGSVATLVTFKDGAGSTLGYTMAPATGGSNINGMATPIRTGANATFDFQATTPVSVLYATVKGFKAP